MNPYRDKFHNLLPLVVSLVATAIVASPAALAGPDEDEHVKVDALKALHAPSWFLSWSPEPISAFFASSVEYSTNLALKHLPALMQAPPDIVVRPNSLCRYSFDHPDQQEYLRTNFLDIVSGWSTPYQNSNGADPKWDALGEPRDIDHYNTTVFVSVKTKDKETGFVETLGVNPDSGSRDYTAVSMRGGINLLTWRADTAITPLTDSIPWYLVFAAGDKTADKISALSKTPGQRTLKLKALEYMATQAISFGYPFALGQLVAEPKKQPGVYTEVKQRFVVVDINPPQIRTDPSLDRGFSPDDPYPVRAVDPGGSYFSSFVDDVMQYFSATDDCAFGEPVAIRPVLTEQVEGSRAPGNFFETNVTREIIIRANDKGPIEVACPPGESGICYSDITTNKTEVSFWVRVEDHEPPLLIPPRNLVVEATPEMQAAGKALRASDDTSPGDPAYVEVGNAAVFDLGDRYPSVDGDEAVSEFAVDARTTINWTAIDIANNSVGPIPQVITVKTPGTNTTPTAFADAALARVSEPVAITLTGSDPDVIDGVVDPVNFEIVRQPESGFLLAPPNPYFIEDYRRTWEEEGVPCDMQPESTIRFPQQISVADNGTTYILAANPSDCDLGSEQISVFDRDGEFVGSTAVNDGVEEFIVLDGEENVFDKPFGVPVGGRERGIYFLKPLAHEASNVDIFFRPVDENGNLIDDQSRRYSWFTADKKNARRVAVDSKGYAWMHDGILSIFELQGNKEMAKLTSFDQEFRVPLPQLNDGRNNVAGHMATDSEDNLYVTDAQFGRIYKFAPAMSDPDEPIKLIGWMGRCYSGDDCDIENERSFGFSCTDATCENESWVGNDEIAALKMDREAELVACGLPTPDQAVGEDGLELTRGEGCRPGQFNLPTKIALDANDNLYIADYANRRVQRFTSDGGFTGEAKSKCNGSCFVLGDFGRPFKMTVNSFGFYVLDEAKKLLHVFEASPFSEVTPNSAVVKYQSNHDILGPQQSMVDDSFEFAVNDGIMVDSKLVTSAPFTVNVSVTRNFRSPTALPDVLVDGVETDRLQVMEDVAKTFELQGRDLDVHDEGSLTFLITRPPEHGSVMETSDGWQYVPDEHYFGPDEFEFVANDSATSMQAMTSEPALVQVNVLAVPDPVLIEMPEPFEAGVGFPARVMVDVSDVDSSADEVTVYIDWGDDCVDVLGPSEPTINCERDAPDNSGGRIGSINLTLAAGNPGMLIAEHLYVDAGDFDVRVCIGDADANAVPPGSQNYCNDVFTDSVGQTAISVSAKADVAAIFSDDLERDPDTNEIVEAREAGVPTNVEVYVRNRQPSGDSAGGETSVAASTATVELLEDLAFATVPPSCTPTSQQPAQVTCLIQALAPGEESARINFAVVANPALTEELELAVSVHLSATDPEIDGGYYWATALPFKPNPALDPDGDGVPNSDDAFPSDPNEWTDTDNDGVGNNADRDDDGDGLFDAWENRYGLNSLDAADADADIDGDGLSNRMESMNGTHPNAVDSDRDGHNDDVDNCPLQFNQQQHDENGDFLGDTCDSRSYAAAAGAGDADGDLVADMALLRTIDGASTVYVKGGASDTDITLIGVVEEPLRVEALLRIDNLEAGPDQALAAVYTDSSGDAHVRTFNAWTGVQLADYPALDAETTLVATDVVAANFDALLVLGRTDSGVLGIDYRDARDGSLLNAFEILSPHHEVLGLAATGTDAVAVLAVSSNGDLVLQVHRVTDGTLISDRTIGRADGLQARINARRGRFYTLTTSVDGQSEIRVWTTSDANAASQFAVFDDTWMPFAVQVMGWASGSDAVAVAASNRTGDIEVRIYDPITGAELNAIGYLSTPDAPRGLVIADSLAGDATISILSSDAGANVSLEQRAAPTGTKLMTLTAVSIVSPPPPPPPPPPPSGGGGGGTTDLPLLLLWISFLVYRRYRWRGN